MSVEQQVLVVVLFGGMGKLLTNVAGVLDVIYFQMFIDCQLGTF